MADAVDGRVVSLVGARDFTMGGFLHGGDHPQSDVALEAYSQNPKDDPCDGVDCGLEC